MVRDGARALVLCAPLLAVLVAEGVRVLAAKAPGERVARVALAVGAVLLPVALLPDLALGRRRTGSSRPTTRRRTTRRGELLERP